MRRVALGLVAAWVVGTCVATALLWGKSGILAFNLLPALAVLLAIWLLCVGTPTLFMRRRGKAVVGWMYSAAIASAVAAAVAFFVLFAYPFMVCIPVGMLAAAAAFQAVVRESRGSEPPA